MKLGFQLGIPAWRKTERSNIIALKLFRNTGATLEITTYVAFTSFISQVLKAVKHWIVRDFTPITKGQTHDEQTCPNKECFVRYKEKNDYTKLLETVNAVHALSNVCAVL